MRGTAALEYETVQQRSKLRSNPQEHEAFHEGEFVQTIVANCQVVKRVVRSRSRAARVRSIYSSAWSLYS